MRVYNVSYDLDKPGQNYDGLIAELKKSPKWWHYLKSTWLVLTDESADQLWNRLGRHLDRTDNVLVIQVGRDYSGWLPKEAWDWINANVRGMAA